MQVLHHQLLGLFGEIVLLMVDDIFPDPAERGVAIQVFIDLLALHLSQERDQLPVELREGLHIDEFGQVHLFGLPDIRGLFFVALAGDGIHRKAREPFMVEKKDDPYPLRIAYRPVLFGNNDSGYFGFYRPGPAARHGATRLIDVSNTRKNGFPSL